jgi:hypothetical protein
MLNFYKTTTGSFVCEFTVDETDPTLASLPDMFPEVVAKCVTEFVTSALPCRTYDHEALLGSELYNENPEDARQTLLAVCSQPDSPMVIVPGSKKGRERYQLRRSLVVNFEPYVPF